MRFAIYVFWVETEHLNVETGEKESYSILFGKRKVTLFPKRKVAKILFGKMKLSYVITLRKKEITFLIFGTIKVALLFRKVVLLHSYPSLFIITIDWNDRRPIRGLSQILARWAIP